MRHKVNGENSVDRAQESMPSKIQQRMFEIAKLVLLLFHLAGLILFEFERLLRDAMSMHGAMLRNTLL